MFRDPELLNELYVTKNKYFDKHHLGKDLFTPIMGDAILLDKSTDHWMQRRKVLSTAFYKEKLMQMMVIVKNCMTEKVAHWQKEFVDTGKPMDMIQEVSRVFIKIVLCCTFGKDFSEQMLPYYE